MKMHEAPSFWTFFASSAAALGVKSSGSMSAATMVPALLWLRSFRSVRPGELTLDTGLCVFVHESVVDVYVGSLCSEAELPSLLARGVPTSYHGHVIM